MKISKVETKLFEYTSYVESDDEGHGHPAKNPRKVSQCMVIIETDEGHKGYSFGANPQIVDKVIAPILLGENPFFREKIWEKMMHMQRIVTQIDERILSAIDLALWDLVGIIMGQPVNNILGLYRDKVPAYASTMCGDTIKGGLSTPDEYGNFAEWCVKERGYRAVKLHGWMPPIEGAPDPKKDIMACAAVREAVGDDIPLMLDSYHFYSRMEALWIGRELEKLNFYWFEEPMDESSMSSYKWLSDQLDIPVIGPETMTGKISTRAEWIKNDVIDILRGGVGDLGGLTPLMKVAHLAESYNMAMEVHGGKEGNLHALGSMRLPGEFYERGLLHPHVDYEKPPDYLNEIMDPMDDEGFIHMPTGNGLGWKINHDYINDNLINDDESHQKARRSY